MHDPIFFKLKVQIFQAIIFRTAPLGLLKYPRHMKIIHTYKHENFPKIIRPKASMYTQYNNLPAMKLNNKYRL